MNRYFMIRRLRVPVFLMLIGVMFLLKEMHVLGIHQSWPLILIFFGVFMLAERAALSDEEMYSPMPVQGAAAQPNSAQPTNAIVPAHEQEYGNRHEGDQS
jgi:LiaI-LiaF-like transmembrane region